MDYGRFRAPYMAVSSGRYGDTRIAEPAPHTPQNHPHMAVHHVTNPRHFKTEFENKMIFLIPLIATVLLLPAILADDWRPIGVAGLATVIGLLWLVNQ